MDKQLHDFFNRKYETIVNRQMMSLNYKLPEEEIVTYVRSLINIPLESYFAYVRDNLSLVTLTSYDIPQFSSWEVGTRKIRRVMIAAGDGGFIREDIGKLLRDDKNPRTDTANRKYGEGHAKLGTWMGLLYELAMTYYVSCLGYVVDEMPNEEYQRLLTRLLMRMPFIQYLIQSSRCRQIDVKADCKALGLSEITCYRRHSNIMCVIDQLCRTTEMDLCEFRNKIDIDGLIAMPVHLLVKKSKRGAARG